MKRQLSSEQKSKALRGLPEGPYCIKKGEQEKRERIISLGEKGINFHLRNIFECIRWDTPGNVKTKDFLEHETNGER